MHPESEQPNGVRVSESANRAGVRYGERWRGRGSSNPEDQRRDAPHPQRGEREAVAHVIPPPPPIPDDGGALQSSGADAALLRMAHSRAETIQEHSRRRGLPLRIEGGRAPACRWTLRVRCHVNRCTCRVNSAMRYAASKVLYRVAGWILKRPKKDAPGPPRALFAA